VWLSVGRGAGAADSRPGWQPGTFGTTTGLSRCGPGARGPAAGLCPARRISPAHRRRRACRHPLGARRRRPHRPPVLSRKAYAAPTGTDTPCLCVCVCVCVCSAPSTLLAFQQMLDREHVDIKVSERVGNGKFFGGKTVYYDVTSKVSAAPKPPSAPAVCGRLVSVPGERHRERKRGHEAIHTGRTPQSTNSLITPSLWRRLYVCVYVCACMLLPLWVWLGVRSSTTVRRSRGATRTLPGCKRRC
jgi:hypothetical protein